MLVCFNYTHICLRFFEDDLFICSLRVRSFGGQVLHCAALYTLFSLTKIFRIQVKTLGNAASFLNYFLI